MPTTVMYWVVLRDDELGKIFMVSNPPAPLLRPLRRQHGKP